MAHQALFYLVGSRRNRKKRCDEKEDAYYTKCVESIHYLLESLLGYGLRVAGLKLQHATHRMLSFLTVKSNPDSASTVIPIGG